MYGVPVTLDLTTFRDAELTSVCLGPGDVQLHFHPDGSILIEGGWELLASDGEWIDGRTRGHPPAVPTHLGRLLSRTVTGWQVSAPNWFSLTFDTGDVLRVFDDSQQYESFSIQPGDIFV